MDADRDRNLLFAIFALQHGLAKKDDVVAAMNAWVLEKHRPLADLLVERGAMKPAGRQMLDNLLDFHIAAVGDAANAKECQTKAAGHRTPAGK